MTDWNSKFVELARFIAGWSKDRSRKVGAVIVGPSKEILSIGYNGFPTGVNDDVEARHERPAKYAWTEHAERNAIYNAARVGVGLEGSTIYLPWYPCMDCARAIVQVGINDVVAVEPDWDDPKFGPDFKLVKELFDEVDVWVTFVPGEAPKQV